MKHREIYFRLSLPQPEIHFHWRGWLPTRGNVIFTLAMITLLVLAQSVGALPLGRPQAAPDAASTGTIAYQGRLADAAGAPLTGTYNMIFRLYSVATGGTPLWSEQWTGSNGVRVSDGLFNVMLGSLTALPQSVIAGRNQLFLGITVGTDDEMAPRVQLGSVPFAVQALTVPDGSVSTTKIADGAVTQAKLGADVSLVPPDGSITTAKIADGAVTTAKLDNNLEVNGHLTVTGDDGYGILRINQGEHPTGIRWERPGYDTTLVGLVSWGFVIHNAVDDRDDLVIAENGNVGIGTRGQSPAAKLQVNGNFLVTNGTKSAVVQTSTGERKLYAIEAPDVRFSDEGMARLQDGVARVGLDPIFLETIEGDYLVHVTPYGNASLYVADIGQDYFVVKARAGDPDVAFAWRLSATRKGYAGVRLEEVKGVEHEAAK